MKESGILFANSLTRQPSREDIGVRSISKLCLLFTVLHQSYNLAINFESPRTRRKNQI